MYKAREVELVTALLLLSACATLDLKAQSEENPHSTQNLQSAQRAQSEQKTQHTFLAQSRKELSSSESPALRQAASSLMETICSTFGTKDAALSKKISSYEDEFCAHSQAPEANKILTFQIIQQTVVPFQTATGLSKIQRASIALDTLANIASPVHNIGQVGNTCKFASYEVRTATLNPELYASLIMQVALLGKFKCTDGSEIIYPLNSLSNVETAKYANWASRIFQVTAANIGWQTSTERPDKLQADKGSLRFELVGKIESLRDYSLDKNKGLAVFSRDGSKVKSPHTNRKQEKLINKLITGEETITVINEEWKGHPEPGTFNYSSYAQLQKFLQYVAEGRLPNIHFPLMISVDGDRLQANGKPVLHNKEGSHLVTIISYDPKTTRVELNNTWYDDDDYVGDRALTFQKLCEYLPRPEN